MDAIINFFWSILQTLGLTNIKANVVFLGLDNAGKTTLLHVLKNNHLKQPVPTFHPTNEELIIEGITFQTWDLGGHETARKVWRDYFPVVDAIIYLVDASDHERIPEAHEELQKLLDNRDLSKIPFAILGNKVDKTNALSEDELLSKLYLHNSITGKGTVSLNNIRPLELFMCSVVNHEGYGEAFKWISQYLK